MDKDNANPTILNVSELPTRQNKKRAAATPGKDAESELDIVLRRPEYLSAPFCDVPWASDDTDSDDGFTIEPIDEQEIYGGFYRSLFPLVFSYRSLVLSRCRPVSLSSGRWRCYLVWVNAPPSSLHVSASR